MIFRVFASEGRKINNLKSHKPLKDIIKINGIISSDKMTVQLFLWVIDLPGNILKNNKKSANYLVRLSFFLFPWLLFGVNNPFFNFDYRIIFLYCQ